MRKLSATDLQELSISEQELIFNYCASRGGSKEASKKAFFLAIAGLLVMVFDYYFNTSKPFDGNITSWVSEAQSIIITASEFLLPALVLAYIWIAKDSLQNLRVPIQIRA